MAKVRNERLREELKKTISAIIFDMKDPRIPAVTSITEMEVTPDLKYAKVYLSIFANDEEKTKSAFDTICRSKVFIRNMLKDRVQIRLLPELNFIMDDSVEYSAKIEQLIQQIHANDASPAPQSSEDGTNDSQG